MDGNRRWPRTLRRVAKRCAERVRLDVFADKGVISKYGIPEKILFVEKLAKTSVGKINKKELREKYGAM